MAKKKQRETYEQIDVIPPACPKCGSTEREGYHEIRRFVISGVTVGGRPYNRMSLKRTCCLSCGQHRVDRVFETVDSVKTAIKRTRNTLNNGQPKTPKTLGRNHGN